MSLLASAGRIALFLMPTIATGQTPSNREADEIVVRFQLLDLEGQPVQEDAGLRPVAHVKYEPSKTMSPFHVVRNYMPRQCTFTAAGLEVRLDHTSGFSPYLGGLTCMSGTCTGVAP